MNVPGRQSLLIFWQARICSVFLGVVSLLFVFTQHCKAKQTKSVSLYLRLYRSISTCASPIWTQGTLFAVTEQQFYHFGTSSWNSSEVQANSLDSVFGNSRDIQTECKGPCPLGAIFWAISGIFFSLFSLPLSLMRRQHMPQHAVAYRKTRGTQRLLSPSSSFSGHRRPKLWEMFWVKNIQAFQKAVVITVASSFLFLFFLIAGKSMYV